MDRTEGAHEEGAISGAAQGSGQKGRRGRSADTASTTLAATTGVTQVPCPECEGRGKVMGFDRSRGSPGSAGWKALPCPLCGGGGSVSEGVAARRLEEDEAARAGAAKERRGRDSRA